MEKEKLYENGYSETNIESMVYVFAHDASRNNNYVMININNKLKFLKLLKINQGQQISAVNTI